MWRGEGANTSLAVGSNRGGESPDNELDDLAFLDAQIEAVQTSHGRKVEGSGKGYRSIINGMLIEKPPPPERRRDARAAIALKSRLKEAEAGRKTKGKKKK